jgi:hypothetical protein
MNMDGHGSLATKEHKGPERLKRRRGARCGGADFRLRDPIALAFARERDARRCVVWPLECESVFAHVFKCVCCGKTRPEEERREPESEVCVQCVRAAGFRN